MMRGNSKKSNLGIVKCFRLYPQDLDYLDLEAKIKKTNISTIIRGLIRSKIQEKKLFEKTIKNQKIE